MDEDTLKLYEELPGIEGRHVRFHIQKKEPVSIRRQFGRCPFLNCDKMCQFQVNGTPELMPVVCRTYPREGVRYDKEARVVFSLSCPAVAKLFMEHLGRREYVKTDRPLEFFWSIDNEDDDFMAFLKRDEEKLLDFLWQEDKDLSEIWPAMYAYLYQENDRIIRDQLERTDEVELTFDKEKHGEYVLLRDPTYSFLKIKTIDHMVLDHITYSSLSVKEPKFFHLIRRYADIFGRQYLDKVDDYFDSQMRQMMEECPEAKLKFKSYFSWTLQEIFPLSFEYYSVLRQFLFAVLYTQLYMIFDLVDYMEKGKNRSMDRQAEVLYTIEQGIRHNPRLNQNLMNVIRDEFL